MNTRLNAQLSTGFTGAGRARCVPCLGRSLRLPFVRFALGLPCPFPLLAGPTTCAATYLGSCTSSTTCTSACASSSSNPCPCIRTCTAMATHSRTYMPTNPCSKPCSCISPYPSTKSCADSSSDPYSCTCTGTPTASEPCSRMSTNACMQAISKCLSTGESSTDACTDSSPDPVQSCTHNVCSKADSSPETM